MYKLDPLPTIVERKSIARSDMLEGGVRHRLWITEDPDGDPYLLFDTANGKNGTGAIPIKELQKLLEIEILALKEDPLKRNFKYKELDDRMNIFIEETEAMNRPLVSTKIFKLAGYLAVTWCFGNTKFEKGHPVLEYEDYYIIESTNFHVKRKKKDIQSMVTLCKKEDFSAVTCTVDSQH